MDKDISPEVQKVMNEIQENIINFYNESGLLDLINKRKQIYSRPKVRRRNIRKAVKQRRIYFEIRQRFTEPIEMVCISGNLSDFQDNPDC